MKNIIALVVPHGDDECLGFGGVIQTHVDKGDEVHVVFCRAPIDLRTHQQFLDIEKSKQILGYHHSHYLFVTESEISNQPLLLFRKIELKLKEISPTIVYTTFWGDIHQDHKITYDCVCRVVRVWGELNVHSFFVGEIPSSTDQYPTITGVSFTPNYYIPITKQQLDTKIKSLEAYSTEMKHHPHPRSSKGILTKALLRGQECGHEYAESFISLRQIIA